MMARDIRKNVRVRQQSNADRFLDLWVNLIEKTICNTQCMQRIRYRVSTNSTELDIYVIINNI